MNHPFLTNRKLGIYYLLVWILVAGIHFFILFLYLGQRAAISLADAAVFDSIMAFLGLALWYPVRYINTEKNPSYFIILNHLLAVSVAVAIWLSIGYGLLHSLFTDTAYADFLHRSLAWRIILGALMYLGLILVYYLMVSYYNLEERTRNAARLETLVRESELNMLRAQIHPHFLFNSLNSISHLTLTDPPRAQEMIIKLSEFLRYALDHRQQDKSPLGEEIRNIERYLQIEQVRFGERLLFDKQVPDDCLSCLLPNLVLQPLFENAIKHGVYESTEPVTIRLECRNTGEHLIIHILNNYDIQAKPRERKGIGLKNISDRLKLQYNSDNLMQVNRKEGMFEVTLSIPQTPPNGTL